MNTKVKIGVAIAIVTALIALIVLDQSTSPSSTDGPPSPTTVQGAPQQTTPQLLDIPDDQSLAIPATPEEDSEFKLWNESRDAFRSLTEPIKDLLPEPKPRIKGDPVESVRDIPQTPPAAADEYVVQPGDTYEGIARKKYGKGSMWNVIAKANPDVKPYALRVGKKIVLPPKPAPVAHTISVTPSTSAGLGGGKVHEVQPGDTLTGISKRYFNTIRHHEAIYQANKATIKSPDALQVGMKLTIPTLDVRPAGQGVVETSTPAPANGSLYTVKEGDKLWTIAKRHRGQRGILEMIKAIVSANPGKLRKDTTPLRVGWKLVIPN